MTAKEIVLHVTSALEQEEWFIYFNFFIQAICIGNDFLSRTQVAQQLRERINKWDYMKLKSFCTKKEMVSKL
jgi:hypothetical protein